MARRKPGKNKMAVKYPAFRKKFPLLVTGSLLALQPVAVPFAFAAEQYDCQVSASGGWACAPKASAAALPARPAPRATVAGADASSGGQAQEEVTKRLWSPKAAVKVWPR